MTVMSTPPLQGVSETRHVTPIVGLFPLIEPVDESAGDSADKPGDESVDQQVVEPMDNAFFQGIEGKWADTSNLERSAGIFGLKSDATGTATETIPYHSGPLYLPVRTSHPPRRRRVVESTSESSEEVHGPNGLTGSRRIRRYGSGMRKSAVPIHVPALESSPDCGQNRESDDSESDVVPPGRTPGTVTVQPIRNPGITLEDVPGLNSSSESEDTEAVEEKVPSPVYDEDALITIEDLTPQSEEGEVREKKLPFVVGPYVLPERLLRTMNRGADVMLDRPVLLPILIGNGLVGLIVLVVLALVYHGNGCHW